MTLLLIFKNPLSIICAAHGLLVVWPSIGMLSIYTLKNLSPSPFKTKLPSPSSCQALIASFLAKRKLRVILCHFASPCWDFVWLELAQSCTCCQIPCEFIDATALLCLENFVLLPSSTTSGSYRLLTLSSTVILEPEEEGVPFRCFI